MADIVHNVLEKNIMKSGIAIDMIMVAAADSSEGQTGWAECRPLSCRRALRPPLTRWGTCPKNTSDDSAVGGTSVRSRNRRVACCFGELAQVGGVLRKELVDHGEVSWLSSDRQEGWRGSCRLESPPE